MMVCWIVGFPGSAFAGLSPSRDASIAAAFARMAGKHGLSANATVYTPLRHVGASFF